MAILKCKMCGGTMEYDRAENLAVCPYCGNTSTVFEQDKKLFEQFQGMFQTLLNQQSGTAPEDGFWVEASTEKLLREDGEQIEITYLTKRKADMCTMYVAKKHVIYIFEKGHEKYAAQYQKMVSELRYPNADMERELRNYLPKVVTECRLMDGRSFLAIAKKEGVYPLGMLGILLDRHVAWVVSRMENLCCLLEYNNMVLNALTVDNLFVDPANHQLYLYGGWWFCGYEGAENLGCSGDVKPYLKQGRWRENRNHKSTDLKSLRLAAAKLLGCSGTESLKEHALLPEPFLEFLLGSPEASAGADFSRWDRVLERSYGERKFIPLSVTEAEIFSQQDTKNDSCLPQDG